MARKKVNYLNNKDMLEEIRLSKLSYCEFTDKTREVCDTIVDIPKSEKKGQRFRCVSPHLPEEYATTLEARRALCLSDETILLAREGKADRLSAAAYDAAMIEYDLKVADVDAAYAVHTSANDLIYSAAVATAASDMRDSLVGVTDPVMISKIEKANRALVTKHNKERNSSNSAVKQKALAKPAKKDFIILPEDIKIEDLVVRFHTFEFIPLMDLEDMARKPVTEADYRTKLPYVPFIHYVIDTDSNGCYSLREVGRSHWKNGEFCADAGGITNNLAKMYMLLAEKISNNHGWRGYSYLDEMIGSSLLHLSAVGLQFNEARSDRPFSYLTSTVDRVFLRVLLVEKKQQSIRDDLIESAGCTPSNARQLQHEAMIIAEREKLHGNKK